MIARKLFIFPIRVYQKYISVLFPPCCRFSPSCSQYAVNAISKHGIIYGIYLGSLRILRCNPWFEGGYDPVPDDFSFSAHISNIFGRIKFFFKNNNLRTLYNYFFCKESQKNKTNIQI